MLKLRWPKLGFGKSNHRKIRGGNGLVRSECPLITLLYWFDVRPLIFDIRMSR